MSTSAQRDLYDEMYEQPLVLGNTGTDGAAEANGSAALRHIAAERLAAHRHRRAVLEPRAVPTVRSAPVISEAAQRVRDAVAARYQATPTFREFLETQPAPVPASPWVEEPVHVAHPVGFVEAPEIAAASALADGAEQSSIASFSETASVALNEEAWDWQTAGTSVAFEGELEVRPYQELPPATPLPERTRVEPAVHPEEIEGLEEEIEFRLAPEFVEHLIEPLPIQANIIEFPRQLIAAKKARPRLAEGPLRSDEATAPPAAAPIVDAVPEFQMRIFEVEVAEVEEPETVQGIHAEAVAANVIEPVISEPRAPEWQAMVLDTPKKTHAEAARRVETEAEAATSLQNLPVAPFQLRLMSSVVDAVCVSMSFIAFVSIAVWMSGHAAETALRETSIPLMATLAVAGVALLAMIYQAVFFSLGATTPGMSYAGLVFRTMTGKQPSRGALRKRVGANVLAVAPIGLGIVWSLFDGQKLGWNDRMSGVFLKEF
jgi:hypothetical protein